ncbi:MAG: phosphoribosylamine--glycine ligase [Candidatus Thalassarchaeaceae archaeon]|nr:phosphoribosylamine--glycine ligase [Candidatus Thalassarchaeaceae archaeon]
MDGFEVLVVGAGGREHAIAIGLSESESVSKVHCCPGNAGTSIVGTNHPVSTSDIGGIVELAKRLDVGLVVVGPEAPLVNGLADRLRASTIPCFGPHSEGAMLEGSKLHAKKIMKTIGVPTGDFEIVEDIDSLQTSLDAFNPPWVVKRDILAGGKGVIVTESREEATEALREAIHSDGFALIEEHLPGEEASVLVVMDESGFVLLPASQDHKRVADGDEGPNTGGMGAYAPAPIATPTVLTRVTEEIIEPMHHYLRNQEPPFRGCLYVGLMIDEGGAPRVVEFNVRLGDPEAQVTIPLISSDLGRILLAAASGRVGGTEVTFHDRCAATVVLASEGYPAAPITGRIVSGWDSRIDEGRVAGFVHLAGARLGGNGELLSDGGRVLSATGVAPDLGNALEAAYQIIGGVKLEGGHFRNDIGFRAFSR